MHYGSFGKWRFCRGTFISSIDSINKAYRRQIVEREIFFGKSKNSRRAANEAFFILA